MGVTDPFTESAITDDEADPRPTRQLDQPGDRGAVGW